MKKFLENILAFLGLCLFGFFIAYALVYAWDFESDLQEKKELEYLYERDPNGGR